MNAEEFINLFNGQTPNVTTTRDGEVVNGDVCFTAINYLATSAVVNGYVFKNNVSFEGLTLNLGVRFLNCKFEKDMFFKQVSAKGFSVAFNEDSVSLLFEACQFANTLYIGGNDTVIDRMIKLKGCTLSDGLTLEAITISKESVYIDEKCAISRIIEVRECNLKQGLTITKSELDAQVRIEGGVLGSLSFLGSTFRRDIFVRHLIIDNGVVFNNGQYDDEVKFQCIDGGRNAKHSLAVHDGVFKDTFAVEYEDIQHTVICGFKSLYFDSCEFNNGLEIDGLRNVAAEKPKVDFITLKVSSKLQGDISIHNLHVGDILLNGINQKATIKFESIHVNRLHVEEFHNYSKLIFVGLHQSYLDWFSRDHSDLKIEGLLSFDRSNLGNSQFFSFDFQSFNKLNFNHVNLSECSFFNVKWFDPVKIGIVTNDEEWLQGYKKQKKRITEDDTIPREYQSRREIFRQLKLACEKQRDTVQALEFKRWEMHYYQSYLQITKHKNLNDRFILWSSRSNDFGQSWLTAVKWMFAFTFPIYACIALLGSEALDQTKFARSCADIVLNVREILWSQIPAYFQLLNPAHILSRIFTSVESKPGIIQILDFIFRIISTYFIFQTVSAFRKYLK